MDMISGLRYKAKKQREEKNAQDEEQPEPTASQKGEDDPEEARNAEPAESPSEESES